MHFRSHQLLLLWPVLTLLPLVQAPCASAQTILYDNTITQSGGVLFRGSTNQGGNTATNMNVDDLQLAPGSGGKIINHFAFVEYNSAAAPVTARLNFFFWAANGSGGNPGTYLAGLTLPPVTLAPQAGTFFREDISGFAVPANGRIWAGISYDDDFGATGATPAQLDALGALEFNPPVIGSSQFGAGYGPPGSYAGVNNPSITNYDFGGTVPVNLGWKLRAEATPEPGSLAFFTAGTVGIGMFSRRRIAKVRGRQGNTRDNA